MGARSCGAGDGGGRDGNGDRGHAKPSQWEHGQPHALLQVPAGDWGREPRDPRGRRGQRLHRETLHAVPHNDAGDEVDRLRHDRMGTIPPRSRRDLIASLRVGEGNGRRDDEYSRPGGGEVGTQLGSDVACTSAVRACVNTSGGTTQAGNAQAHALVIPPALPHGRRGAHEGDRDPKCDEGALPSSDVGSASSGQPCVKSGSRETGTRRINYDAEVPRDEGGDSQDNKAAASREDLLRQLRGLPGQHRGRTFQTGKHERDHHRPHASNAYIDEDHEVRRKRGRTHPQDDGLQAASAANNGHILPVGATKS